MANYVDFSNAHIECVNRENFSRKNYFGLYISNTNNIISSGEGASNFIATVNSKYLGNITPNSFSIYVSGQFTQSGNEFYISANTTNNYTSITGYYHTWKITNIAFDAGDLFNFQININFNCE